MSFKKLFPLRAICTPVRMLATFIAVIIVMNLLEINPTKATNLTDEPYVNTIGDLTMEQLATATLTSDYIPEMISDETVVEKGHVNRLLAQEPDFCTVLFQNRDGTKTGYLFPQSVKYRDGKGIIRDKQNVLSEAIEKDTYKEDYLFVNPYNDIKTYYPRNISLDKGMILETADIKVELAPMSVKNNNAVRMAFESTAQKAKIVENNRSKDAVEYGGVFGNGTALRYSSTYEGFKEDIILYENTGLNRFSFRLLTNGLRLICDAEGQYHLVDPLTGKNAADIGNIIVYDSGCFRQIPDFKATHYYEVDVVVSNQEYILTVIVDENFLNDSNTVYPVYVDPDIIVSGSGASKTIQDVPIYYNTSTNQGSNLYNHIGLVTPTSWGAGRMLMRFPGLNANSIYNNTAYGITRLKLFLYETSGNSTVSTITAYQYTGSSSWTETGATSSNVTWDGYSTTYQPVSIGSSSSGYISFNLTNAVYPWKSNSTSYNQGIMLKNSNESATDNNKVFNSTEYSSNKPYLTFDYATPTTMAAGTTYNGSITDGGCVWYKFTPTTSGTYVFETSGSTDTFGELYVGASATLTLPNDDDGPGSNFKITYALSAGVEYRLKVRGYSVSTTGSYSLTTKASVITIPTGPTSGIGYGSSYILKNNSGYFMDVFDHQTSIGSGVCQWTYTGKTNQKFIIEYQSNGEYIIRIGEDENIYVAVDSSGNVVLSSSSTAEASRWYIVSSGSNYRIVNKSDITKYLGASNGIVYLYLTSSTNYATWSLTDYDAFSKLGGLANRTVSIQRVGSTTSNTTWLPRINAAVNAWNNSGSGTNISTTTASSSHTIEVKSDPSNPAYGWCIKNPVGNEVATSSTIIVNTATIGSTNNFRESTIAHEIGHLLWLSDNPYTISSDSLMHGSRDRNTIFVPQPYDINNVNFRYN